MKRMVLICVLIGFVFLQIPEVWAETKASDIDRMAKVARLSGRVHLDFKDTDISVFIKFISELTGKNFVVSPDVRGKVTIISPKAVTMKDAYRVFLSVLEANKFTVVSAGKFYRIVPLRSISRRGVPSYSGRKSPASGSVFITQVIPVVNADVKDVYRVVRPLVSLYGNITFSVSSNTIIVTDSASNVRRILSVVRNIDRVDVEIKVVTLRYADAAVIAKKLSSIAGKGADWLPRFRVVVYERGNSLLLVSSRNTMHRLLSIVKRLDRKVPVSRNMFHIYHLSNANAKKVAKSLSAIVKSMVKGAKAGADVVVAADPDTNSIIIKATPEEYAALLPVIKDMDRKRRQVLIKALIVEVNLTKLHKEGFSWEAIGGKIWDTVMYGGHIITGGGSDFSRFLGVIGNKTVTEVVAATLNLINKHGALNVLSSPQITCLDNEQASLMVGQVIPRLKNETTNITKTSVVNKSYEYEKIGLELRVVPHITSNSFVRLEINQVVEELLTPIGSPTPTTSRRALSTTVVVNNGETVVLGGLMKNIVKKELWKAPILSDIPIIGGLFKAVNTERGKIDLIIFLTPYIIQSPSALTSISKPYKEKIKSLKEWDTYWKRWLKDRNAEKKNK